MLVVPPASSLYAKLIASLIQLHPRRTDVFINLLTIIFPHVEKKEAKFKANLKL